MEKTLLVTVEIEGEKRAWPLEEAAIELEELASSAGAQIMDNILCTREKPTPNLFVGKGKAEEIAVMCSELKAQTVIFSHDLSGTQQRNLEEVIGKKTIDRTQLILDIFARHAKTPEGKMQVELAQLEYLLPRLSDQNVAYTRTGGGIGTRGPGEQKLEVDRRRIRERIDRLRKDLKDVVLHRELMRKRRQEKDIPSIAIVGYTSAGKSTLLNALTGSSQTESPKLFTTLDPLTRPLELPDGGRAVISDTVGFIQNLPHGLVNAFRATLEEVSESDVLIHVVDVSNRLHKQQSDAVNAVLKELGVEEKPVIIALNKIDTIPPEAVQAVAGEYQDAVQVSAKTGQNLGELMKRVSSLMAPRMATVTFLLPHTAMSLVNQLHSIGKVKETEYLQEGIKITVSLQKIEISNILQNKGIKLLS